MITTRHKLTRYSGSLAVVLGVHALAIALALNWTARPPIELPPQAMMVELAPLPAPPPPAPPKVVTPPQPPARLKSYRFRNWLKHRKRKSRYPNPSRSPSQNRRSRSRRSCPSRRRRNLPRRSRPTLNRPRHQRRNQPSPHPAHRLLNWQPRPVGKAPCSRICRSTRSTRKVHSRVARKV